MRVQDPDEEGHEVGAVFLFDTTPGAQPQGQTVQRRPGDWHQAQQFVDVGREVGQAVHLQAQQGPLLHGRVGILQEVLQCTPQLGGAVRTLEPRVARQE